MEQKTPARGHSFGPTRVGPAPIRPAAIKPDHDLVLIARNIAQSFASILPDGFDKVLPRGYSLTGHALLMARYEVIESRGQALYARHNHWGDKEARMFLRDLKDGWLDEVSSFMRWQLRTDPVQNAIFQHALVHVKDDAMRGVLVSA